MTDARAAGGPPDEAAGGEGPKAPNPSRRPIFVGVLLYLVSFGLLNLFTRIGQVWGVVLGALVLVPATIVLSMGLRRYRKEGTAVRLRWAVPAAIVVAAVALMGLWALGLGSDGWGFFGLCLLFLGVGQLLTEWRWSDPRTIRWGLAIVVLCAAAFFAGLIGVSSGSAPWGWLAAGGVLASPIGLSLLSGGVLRRLKDRGIPSPRALWLLVGGAIAGIAVGVWLLVLVGGIQFWYALGSSVALSLLVGAIASNTPADVLVVVAVVALTWAVSPRGVAPGPEVVPDEREAVIVALGDSFMSGEGAREFYKGTNEKGRNECRRAPTAYAPLVVALDSDAVPDDLAFVACSAARATHIYESAQYPGEPLDGPGQGLNQLAHLDWLRRDKAVDVKLVIVSIGGNDARFGEIGLSCIGPGDCSEIGAIWLANLDHVKTQVDTAYQKIRDHVGDDVPVLVVPYPIPLNETGCPWSLLTPNEHRFLNGFTRELNQVLSRAARDAGLQYLGEMERALEGLRICDNRANEVGVNFFGLNAVNGLVEQSVNPLNWFHNSLHPNRRGHQAMRDTLAAWLSRNPDTQPAPDPTSEVGPPATASIEAIMGAPDFRHCGTPDSGLAHCGGSPNDWMLGQVADVIWRSLPGVFLVIAGAWAPWLLVIWLTRRWRDKREVRRKENEVASPSGSGGS